MQAAVSLLMAAILIIWTAVTFRQPLPRPLPDNLAINYNGLSAIAVMPISLFSASVFRCAFPAPMNPSSLKQILHFNGHQSPCYGCQKAPSAMEEQAYLSGFQDSYPSGIAD